MASETLRATRLTGRRSRRPKVYSEGRVCAREGCDTKISRYNQHRFCHRHAPARYPRVRGEFVTGT